ncbi:MAG TPA: hypothetical protein VJO52_05025 [Gemmatimonadaceae bacterium]|nr:hypothetical protein [Gemmatimonadaceae bacterium]
MFVVWSPQRGATEGDVAAATTLIPDTRVRDYWDPDRVVGTAYATVLGSSEPAWDVYMLFGADAVWRGVAPRPVWYEHQLGSLPPERHLDPDRFAVKARALEATVH